MPQCGCAGSSCSCLVIAGRNIRTGGTGSISDPYVVSYYIPTETRTKNSDPLDLSLLGGRTAVQVSSSRSIYGSDWIMPSDVFEMTLEINNSSTSSIQIEFPPEVTTSGTISTLTAGRSLLLRLTSIPGGAIYASARTVFVPAS